MSITKNIKISTELKSYLNRSALSVEDFTAEELPFAERFFWGDDSIYQAEEVFRFYEEQAERTDNEDEDVVWIVKEEWSFDKAGLHHGVILSYSLYTKNDTDFVLLRILYSPGIIKLVRFSLSGNDAVAMGIIDEYGNRLNLKSLVGRYVGIHIGNINRNDKGEIFSNITNFHFVSDEEYNFIMETYDKLCEATCDEEDEEGGEE